VIARSELLLFPALSSGLVAAALAEGTVIGALDHQRVLRSRIRGHLCILLGHSMLAKLLE